MKNHCDKLHAQAANERLVWAGYVLSKRENPRLIGDYITTRIQVLTHVHNHFDADPS